MQTAADRMDRRGMKFCISPYGNHGLDLSLQFGLIALFGSSRANDVLKDIVGKFTSTTGLSYRAHEFFSFISVTLIYHSKYLALLNGYRWQFGK